MRLHSRRGYNKFKRSKDRKITLFWLALTIVSCLVLNYMRIEHERQELSFDFQVQAMAQNTFNSIPATPSAKVEPEVEKSPNYEAIKADIYHVFGKDADKAMLVLSCENKGLRPDAVNHNNDSIKSTDYGIFQINDHWQGVTNVAFLKDPAINIRMAYRIYVNNGRSFERWTCGRKFGV